MNDQELDREIKATALRPLADKFQELARQIDSGKYDLPKSLADAEKITENYISQAYERIEKLVKQDQALREIDISIDELKLLRADRNKLDLYEYHDIDSDRLNSQENGEQIKSDQVLEYIEERIAELQAQKDKLMEDM